MTDTTNLPTEHFELYEQDLADNYHERIGALRERCPVFWSDGHWSETGAGFWVIDRHEEVLSAATDWRTFSSAQGAAPVQFDLNVFRMVPLETDPPVHRNIRRVISPYFAPEALKSAEDGIKRLVGELLDGCVAQSPADFMLNYAVSLPPRVFFEIFLGEDPAEIGWMIETIDTLFANPEAAAEKAPLILGWASDVLEGRRAAGRKDDVLGAVAHAGNAEGFTMTELERIQTVMLLILAGMETTSTALGHIAYRLAADPDLRATIRAMSSAEVDDIVEEFLRFDSPVPAAGRTLTQDVEIGGCPMRSGDRVVLSWIGANRDPRTFPNPDILDITRDANKHVAFGAGPHRCLGSHLAKRELRITIEEICKLSQFDLVPATEVAYRAGPARGPQTLPIIAAR